MRKREAAVKAKKLCPLMSEESLWSSSSKLGLGEEAHTFSDETLVKARRVREFFNGKVKEHTARNIKESLLEYDAHMMDEDDCWAAESGWWWHMIGIEGERLLLAALHDHLPSSEASKDLDKTAQFLLKLQSSQLYKLQGPDAQLILDEAVVCVEAMNGGESPPIKQEPVRELQLVYASLPYFLRGNGADGVERAGKAYWSIMMCEQLDIIDQDGLQKFVDWCWLGNNEDRAKVEAKRKEFRDKALADEKTEKQLRKEAAEKKKADAEAAKAAKAAAAQEVLDKKKADGAGKAAKAAAKAKADAAKGSSSSVLDALKSISGDLPP